MKEKFKKIWLLLIGADDVVRGLPVVRDKEQPSLCYVVTPWYHSLFFGPYSTLAFRDKNHPDYIRLWKERIEKFKSIKV